MSSELWEWRSAANTAEQRRERFLRLIEVVENERRLSTNGFQYHMGDPCYVKFFTRWEAEDRGYCETRWQELRAFKDGVVAA